MLDEIAFSIHQLLFGPQHANHLQRTRELLLCYLDRRLAEAIPHPRDWLPTGGIFDHMENDARLPLAPEQTAAVLSALHDSRCPGVEPVFPDCSGEPELTAENQMSDEFRRQIGWEVLCGLVENLDDAATHWFRVQLSRLRTILDEQASQPSMPSPPSPPSPPVINVLPVSSGSQEQPHRTPSEDTARLPHIDPNSPTTGTLRNEGGMPSADAFDVLRDFARTELMGQERAVIEALCDSNGEMPISNLAYKIKAKWEDPFQGFKDARNRLNQVKSKKKNKPKLKSIGWILERHNNNARLVLEKNRNAKI